MKNIRVISFVFAMSLAAAILYAQDNSNPDHPTGPPPGRHHGPPPPPVMVVLDANHDGVIDAEEIANASKALLTLDKNGDGQLTQDELRPPFPPPPPDGEEGPEEDGPNDGPPPPP
jgi:EF hand